MAIMQWNNSLSVKHDGIDAQHQKLVALINQLGDAMSQGKGKDQVGVVLNGLITYTATHFAFEEKMMVSTNYPKYKEHLAEHQKLVAQVTDLQKKLKDGSQTVTMEVMNFLTQWLVNHIQKVDRQLGAHLATAQSQKRAVGV